MNIIKDREKPKVDELYIFSKEHTHHYITAYRMFLDNKILGVGVKNFRKNDDEKSKNDDVWEGWSKAN